MLGTKHNFLLNSYFPSAIKEWNRLDIDIRKSDSISIFKRYILSFIRPLPNPVSSSHNPQGLKLFTRLRLVLSHLRYHKFKHNSPLCSCGSDIETLLHFFSTPQILWEVETHFLAKFLKFIVMWQHAMICHCLKLSSLAIIHLVNTVCNF